MKNYTIFAGVNGAGKTSIYKSVYYNENDDSLKNLSNVISICDKINIYDNSEMFKLVMVIKDGEIIWKDNKTPNWLNINLK